MATGHNVVNRGHQNAGNDKRNISQKPTFTTSGSCQRASSLDPSDSLLSRTKRNGGNSPNRTLRNKPYIIKTCLNSNLMVKQTNRQSQTFFSTKIVITIVILTTEEPKSPFCSTVPYMSVPLQLAKRIMPASSSLKIYLFYRGL